MPDEFESKNTDERHAQEQDFIDIVDASEIHDAGIAYVEHKMEQVRDMLLAEYANKVYVDSRLADSQAEYLNGNWFHEGETATITGRIFLDDADDRDLLPEDWEDVASDGLGESYLFVEKAELTSLGVCIKPIIDPKKRIIVDFRVAHSFIYGDDDEQVLVYALPGELSSHEYEVPTPEEAEIRLQRRWPKEYDMICRLVDSDDRSSIPSRLKYLLNRVQETIQSSNEFKGLVETVINARLSLSPYEPYITTVSEGPLQVYDPSMDDYDFNDEESWLDVSIEKEMVIYGMEPVVSLVADKTGLVRPLFVLAIYNEEGEQSVDYMRIDAGRIKGFRTTRAMRSVAKRLIERDDSNDHFGMQLTSDNAAPGDDDLRLHGPIERDLESVGRIELLENFNNAIRALIASTKELSDELYSYEDAKHLSGALVREFYSNISEGALFERGLSLELSGSGVSLLNAHFSTNTVEGLDRSVVFGVGKGVHTLPLTPGDTTLGAFDELHDGVLAITDEDDEEGYIPSPCLYFNQIPKRHIILDSNGVSIASVDIQTKGVALLGGMSDISVVELETQKQTEARLKLARSEYKDLSIMSSLDELRKEIFGVSRYDFIPLRHPEYLTDLDKYLEEVRLLGRSVDPALDMLESLMVNRLVMIEGFELESGEEKSEPSAFNGIIIDVRNDIIDDRLVFAIIDAAGGAAESVRYFPLSKITSFKF